jgi:hypothetical protein
MMSLYLKMVKRNLKEIQTEEPLAKKPVKQSQQLLGTFFGT